MKVCEFLFAVIVVTVVGCSYAGKIRYADSKLRLCHEIECPYESVSCTKTLKANADNTKLIISYICDGADGKVLLSKDVEEKNKPTNTHQPYSITKPFLDLLKPNPLTDV